MCPNPTDFSWLAIPAIILAACIGYSIVHRANAATGRWRREDDAK